MSSFSDGILNRMLQAGDPEAAMKQKAVDSFVESQKLSSGTAAAEAVLKIGQLTASAEAADLKLRPSVLNALDKITARLAELV